MRIHLRSAALLFCVGLFSSAASLAAPSATLTRPENVQERIADLKFSSDKLPLAKLTRAGAVYYVVRLKGVLRNKDSHLLFNGQRIPIKAMEMGQEFSILVPLRGPVTPIRFMAVTLIGTVQEEVIQLEFGKYAELVNKKKPSTAARKPVEDPNKKLYTSVAAGPSIITYREAYTPDLTGDFTTEFSSTAITAKASARYVLHPAWDVGANVFFTAAQMTGNIDGATARFIGVNGRIGYVLPFVEEPWRVVLMTGIYYTTMLVSASTPEELFGFQHMMGPQLFPAVRYRLFNGDAVSAYAKFSPVSAGFAFESLSNREMAFGVSWTTGMLSKKPLTFALDIANLDLKLENVADTGRTALINSKSVNVSVGIGF